MIHSEDNAAFLKQEITRLKVKLSELDSDSEPTSAVCGHDVALENLKKTVKEKSHQGLSQLLSYDLENGWYTTNLPTYAIGNYLEDFSTVANFFSLLSRKDTWEILQQCYFKQEPEIENENYKILRKMNFIDEENHLTEKGFLVFAAGGHLCYNATLKQEISKTITISQQIYEITGIHYGEDLLMSANEIIQKLKDTEKWRVIENEGICEKDIKIYLYQMNCHKKKGAS
jgi:hypothetical protein